MDTGGLRIVEIEYDPDKRNWDDRIRETKRDNEAVTVFAVPKNGRLQRTSNDSSKRRKNG
jgi:hypothetical protein